MRGSLLGARGIRELVEQPDLDARIEWLRATAYGDALEHQLDAELPLHAFDVAVRARLLDELRDIRRFLAETVSPLFDAMLGVVDAYDLETILRSARPGGAVERVWSLLVPTALLDERLLAELARTSNPYEMHALLESRHHPFTIPFADVLGPVRHRRIEHEPSLLALEASIDRFVFARARTYAHADGESGRVCAQIVELAVDVVNAATVLKGVSEATAAACFIPGGRRLGEHQIRQLASRDRAAAAETIAHAMPFPELAMLPLVVARPALVDQLLHRVVVNAVFRLARTHPLSLAVPLSFLLERVTEARAVRLVLRGSDAGASKEELLELVETGAR
jgi:V/A-type H+-transporting ATPase subunit C